MQSASVEGKKEKPTSAFKIAIYARVSPKGAGKGDEREEVSIEIQVVDMEKVLLKNGWKLYDVYKETIQGSFAFEERPEGSRLLADAVAANFNVVMVWDIDRIGRDMEAMAAKTFRFKMRNLGIQVYSINQPYQMKEPDEFRADPFDEGQILQETIQDWQSASTITKFRRRSIRGKLKRAESGKMLTTPPYGYRLESLRDSKGDIVIEKDKRVVSCRVVFDDEAKVVIRIYYEYVFEKRSMNEIRDRLNFDGIPTRKGRSWERAMVARILKNPVYYGALIYNKHYRRRDLLTGKGKWGINPEDKWIVVSPSETEHKEIISKDLFEKAQSIREAKLRIGPVAAYSEYLFSGLAVCGICGSIMYRKKVTSRYRRKSDGVLTVFQCNGYECGRWRRFKDTKRTYISEKDLLNILASDLKKLKDHPEALEAFLSESEKVIADNTESRIAALRSSVEKVKSRFERLLHAYEMGSLSFEKFNAATERLEQEEKRMGDELKELEKLAANKTKREYAKSDFIEAVENFEDVFENGDIKDKKSFLHSLLHSIVINDKEVIINYNLSREGE